MITFSEPRKNALCNNCSEEAVIQVTFEDYNGNGTTIKLCKMCFSELDEKTAEITGD